MNRKVKNLRLHTDSKTLLGFLLFIVCVLFSFFIFHGLPLSLDDYGFLGTSFSSNSEALHWVLGYGNGRLFGNGGIIFLLHHRPLDTLVRAMMIAGIAILLPVSLRVDLLPGSMFAMFLIIKITPGIFGQAFSWMSGFQNYVPPVFLFLSGTWLVQHTGRTGRAGAVLCSLVAAVVGMAMQLYIEHSSCLNLGMSVLLTFAAWKKHEGLPYRVSASCFSSGALLGFVLMLLITGRSTVGHVSYLSGGLPGLMYGISRNAIEIISMFSENVVLILCFSVLVLFNLRRFHNSFKAWETRAVLCGLFLPAAIFCFRAFEGTFSWYGKLIPAETVLTVVAMLLWSVSLFYVLIRLSRVNSSRRIHNCLALCILAIAGLVPLLFIWPIGYRCLFHSYILMCAGALLLLDELMAGLKSEQQKRFLVKGICCLLCISVITLISLFTDIRKMARIREDHITEMARSGAETVEFFNIPSPYIHEVWNEDSEHYAVVDGRKIRLKILPADVWFRRNYYHFS